MNIINMVLFNEYAFPYTGFLILVVLEKLIS